MCPLQNIAASLLCCSLTSTLTPPKPWKDPQEGGPCSNLKKGCTNTMKVNLYKYLWKATLS
ncbi:hypothetical protein M404DRAFT_401798 [Pisolithus tinctorius Marx 270]|uniref:Uncharacterized protein n=1 Tax=Pisolithus tinctorius Marx 270 TaxID=870435 RepID=A0A0C3J9F1_PISTI|nr:hypothetical protein M404DRAFT_401798 [Pisolithus tinctorius Marx 270]